MNDPGQYWREGNLTAYIELLRTGIREVCLPNVAMPSAENLAPVDSEVRKHGFCTLLVSYNRADKGRRRDAESLKKKLQKTLWFNIIWGDLI